MLNVLNFFGKGICLRTLPTTSKPFINRLIIRLATTRSTNGSQAGTNGSGNKPVFIGRSRRQNFLYLTQEQREAQLKEIERQRIEPIPDGIFAKFKYYFKRYGHYAIPIHFGCCALWFGACWLAVQNGVDVIALIERLRAPDYLQKKVKAMPPSAGTFVVALLLYKIITPIRYAASLAVIIFVLRRFGPLGRLKTAKETTLRMRQAMHKSYENTRRFRTKWARNGQRNGHKKGNGNGSAGTKH